MRILDPGHKYHLLSLDTPQPDDYGFQVLTFVKREGPGYPGNVGHHAGTTTQEVLRALINRSLYVNNQIFDWRNDMVTKKLRECILQLELRAAERHERGLYVPKLAGIESMPTCPKCNHIGCPGSCH